MKILSSIAAAAFVGASLITANPAEAKTPSVYLLAGSFAGGFCLYRTGIYEEDAVMARVIDTGKEQGQTPEEVMKMVQSPAFMPIVDHAIKKFGGCVKMSNEQLQAWGWDQRVTQIIR